MKRSLFMLLLILAVTTGFSQLIIDGGNVTVQSGGTLIVEGDITISNSGYIDLDGTAELKGDLINNTASSLTATSSGLLAFNGTAAQEIKGSVAVDFPCDVEIDNSNGISMTAVNGTVENNLTLTSGLLSLNNFDLALGTTDPTGMGSSSYIQTNGTGSLIRSVPADGGTNVIYPVGNTTYNPVTLQNGGSATTDNFGARVIDGLPTNFTSANHAVSRTWELSEEVSGNSDLTVTTSWGAAEEESLFDRTESAVGLTSDNGTNVAWGTSGAATAGPPYTQTGNSLGFTTLGEYIVADYYHNGDGVDLDLDLYLAGAYSGGTMSTAINAFIPLTDPYGLSVTAPSIPATAVDWIHIQLRSDLTTVVKEYAFFLDSGGNLMNVDGTSPVKLDGLTKGSYYVAILHRNHFSVLSGATVDLSTGSGAYNYSTAQAQAWQDPDAATWPTPNTAMKQLATGPDVFGLWEGNANNDGFIKYNGAAADRVAILNTVGVSTPGAIITDVYSDSDVNMDGLVKYNGSGADRITVLNIVGSLTPGVIYTMHMP